MVDHSLLQMDESGLYSLHEQLRQFASSKLAADSDTDAEVRRRHADYFRDQAVLMDRIVLRGWANQR